MAYPTWLSPQGGRIALIRWEPVAELNTIQNEMNLRGLRAQYRQLQDSIASLQREFEKSDDAGVDAGDIRQRLALLLTGLLHQRGRESDLIYEAYYEAFRTDLRQHAQDLAGGAGA